MIRVSLMADKSHLVNAIGTLLASEIGPAAFTCCWTHNVHAAVRNHPSVDIRVDEGEPQNESIAASLLVRVDGSLLVMGLSLRGRNLHVVECHQLDDVSMEHVVGLVRDFCRTYPVITGRGVGAMKQA